MRNLAKEIARNAATASLEGPQMTDLYLYFLKCLNNNQQAAEDAMAEYLEGRIPEPIRDCVQKALGGVATILE